MRGFDLAGNKYGHLLVGVRDVASYHSGIKWLATCDCGESVSVFSKNLRSGKTKSCAGSSCKYNAALRFQLHVDPCGGRDAGMRQVWQLYNYKARRKNIKFAITKEYFADLISGDCHYCGSAPSNIARRDGSAGGMMYSGIDRVDSALGYMPGNVVSCCGKCNLMKNTLRVNDFLGHVEKILAHSRLSLKRTS